ncbi:class I SAM-dependent methyltransferase [Crenothrix polyspora]|uniref:Putative Methyltransferase type 11 n=1 Tax=Crenothrix polyspora TaxID=360316 RepID=A0A1R4GYU3_9GAMM|nr:class I SAM-dependent methyltransferase [Crenothrix polyspora]SJM88980.1 putative Methyltransferase type 11 [Crenothrix polyspora]
MSCDEKSIFFHHQNDVQEMLTRFVNHKIAIDLNGLITLDVGGGGGIQAGFIAHKALKVLCADICDNQQRYGGEFVKLLADKFKRYESSFLIDRVEFHVVDAMNMIYKNNYFDFISSFNAFEHIPDPAMALSECARVLKPGGYIYLTFDPIWTADTGSHFSHLVKSPWAHLILNDEDFINQMHTAGASKQDISDFTYGMNRLKLDYYLNIFSQVEKYGLKILAHVKWAGFADDTNIDHKNFNMCLALGYSKESLSTRGMYFILQKN